MKEGIDENKVGLKIIRDLSDRSQCEWLKMPWESLVNVYINFFPCSYYFLHLANFFNGRSQITRDESI